MYLTEKLYLPNTQNTAENAFEIQNTKILSSNYKTQNTSNVFKIRIAKYLYFKYYTTLLYLSTMV